MKYKPFEHQKKAMEFIESHNKCALMMETGMGKMSVVLSVIGSQKASVQKRKPAIIVTSEANIRNRWIPEKNKWDHLQKLSYGIVEDMCSVNILKANNLSPDIIFLTHNFLQQAMTVYNPPDYFWFFDETEKYLKVRSQNFIMARNICKKCIRVVLLCDFTYLNCPETVWSIGYLIDGGLRFGKDYGGFLEKYFFKKKYWNNGTRKNIYEAKRGSPNRISEMMSSICFSYTRSQATDMQYILMTDRYVDLMPKEKSKYKIVSGAIRKMMATGENEDRAAEKIRAAENGFVGPDKPMYHRKKIDSINNLRHFNRRSRVILIEEEESIRRAYSSLLMKSRIIENYMDLDRWDDCSWIGITSPELIQSVPLPEWNQDIVLILLSVRDTIEDYILESIHEQQEQGKIIVCRIGIGGSKW